jgi:uncharacterized protein (TIGR02147 family)
MMNTDANQNYRDILKIEYESRKARNRYYSLRAFANSIGIGSGALSEILNGKRNLGTAKARDIIEKLNLDENEKGIFLDSVATHKKKQSEGVEHESHHLNMEIFEIVSSPLCMSLLALADVKGFRLDVEWISRKLGASQKEVAHALKLMRTVGLLEVINGYEQICKDFVFSPDGIPSSAIRNYHHQMLDKAHDALDEVPVTRRDFKGLTLAIDPKDLDKIKKEILSFQKRIVKKYQVSEDLKEVYHLQMTLFPLSYEDEQ